MQFKTLIKLILLIATVIFSFSALPKTTQAANDDICSARGVSQAIKDASGCKGKGSTGTVENTIINVLNIIIGIISLIAVIAIIIGGVQYMTSAGEPGKVKKARDTILYAVIGLIICALAATIVNFVIKATTEKKTTLLPQTPETSLSINNLLHFN